MTKLPNILIICLLFLASCSGKHYTTELDKIDSLKMVLDETELMFDEIKIDSLRKMYSAWIKNAQDIKKYYSKDNEANWKIICMYTDMKKPFRSVVKYYDDFRSELVYSQQQLDSLYHDLQYDLLPENLVHEYLADEEKAVGALYNMVSKNLKSAEVLLNDFDSLNKLTEEIIQKINKKEQ
jgi:hypothetical protein